jgi:uncharacterized protein YdeI (YjbR/CyaY-like superfamily)
MKHAIDEAKLLDITDREAWRAWLAAHYRSETEVWLVYWKKHTGRTRIPYNDAVEEALCFGWIDSTVKRLDNDRFAQRFSVRNSGTPYSQANRERLRELVKQGKVVAEVAGTLGDLDHFEMPPDILEAIRLNEKAWQHFQAFSEPYIRIRIAFIDAARNRPREFEKRLQHFLAMTENNKQFGFGGIEKYY